MNIRQAIASDAERLLDFLAAFWADGCDTVINRPSLPNLQQEVDWLSKRTGEDAARSAGNSPVGHHPL
jgi:hypothetical protein